MSTKKITTSEDVFQRGKLIYVNDSPSMEFFDDYEHLDTSIEYAIENVLYEPTTLKNDHEFKQLKDLFNSVFTSFCNCTDSRCSSHDICKHGSNYKVAANSKELVLNGDRVCTDLIYECSQNCKCPPTCMNRLVQYGPRKYLEIIDAAYAEKQCGLTSSLPIPCGGFICEYAGEIITKSEAIERSMYNRKENRMNYVICLNESSVEDGGSQCLQTFIDPSRRGNIGRYLNHSCNPNCEILSVRIDGPLPRLGIFAKRDIEAFEELCFHYGGEQKGCSDEKSIECRCGSENCELFLPNIEF